MFSEIAAIVIFVFMFIMIVMDRFPKHYITLGCGLLTIAVVFLFGMRSTEAVKEAVTVGINWDTIIFLCGMMIMVEGMSEAQFFDWLCIKIAKLAGFEPLKIFVAFMALSAFLAMFIDSITVILFLSAVTIRLARALKFNPVPVILAEIFCANLGGSATMCGDPPNIIIGTALGKSFADFLLNTGLIAGISLIVVIIYFYFSMKNLVVSGNAHVTAENMDVHLHVERKSIREFYTAIVIFAVAIVLLVSHSATGLSVATIGAIVAVATLVCFANKIPKLLKRVDWATLLFFVGLFVVVNGLEQTGVLVVIANFIETISRGNSMIMIAIILWVSAIASAFVDNIPFAATMVPVIQTLAASTGVDISTLAWTLAMGTDIGGSATPIGASANVVGIANAGREGYPIGWGTYCKRLAPATILVLVISMVSIYVRYL